jgi:glycosyltransferase involved in cell wall biosynthesis
MVRIAIAHEWLVRYAGSERCVEQMREAFPDSQLLTSVIRPSAMPHALRDAKPSALQVLPGAASHHEWLLPLMPAAWRLRTPVRDVDAVISSSHACAKAVRVANGIPHLCYCYTPMRYAWDFDAEAERFPAPLRPIARIAMASFRHWDRGTSGRVTTFVAISRAVAGRVERFYGRSARVIHPPVRTTFFTPGDERDDYFLYVGRLVSYKRADLVVEAFSKLPSRLVMVGTGHLESRLRSRAGPNVTFLGDVSDEELRRLYRGACALVYPADEDFGIVMAEAHACGTPVIAFAKGGALDIVEPGLTGWLIERQTINDLQAAVERASVEPLDRAKIRARAERFSEERFRVEFTDAVEAMVAERGRSTGCGARVSSRGIG